MNEYTECEAYRHLLQVAENIIYSIHPDQKILNKYDQLKKSVLAKTTKDKDKDVHKLMIETYKRIIQNSIKAISSFEAQLQEKMQRKNYNQIILKMNQEIQDYFSELQEVQKQSNSKTKLLVKQQIGTLKYQYDQLDSKYQNLGLLIQVHKKMHQIIIEATKSQQKRSSQQTNYKQKINNLQNMIGEIDQASEFIKFHKITQDKFQKYKMASRKLNQLLFENK